MKYLCFLAGLAIANCQLFLPVADAPVIKTVYESSSMDADKAREHVKRTQEKPHTLVEMLKSSKQVQATTDASKPDLGWGGPIFFDVAVMDWYQLIIITCIYGYVLYIGSNMIGDGAEQLTFFPSVAGIVGSVVVPILGAVPDAMMVLCSGLGPDAQSQVTTGVGALAGSTVMLLTFPWMVVNMVGSVPIRPDGTADYQRANEPVSLFKSAVTFNSSIRVNVKVMVITSFAFLIIQIPSFFKDRVGVPTTEQADFERVWAGIGMLFTLISFVAYIGLCYRTANEDKRLAVIIEAIKQKKLGLSAVLANQTSNSELKNEGNLKQILRVFFCRYDLDGNKTLELNEFGYLLRDLGLKLTPEATKQQFELQRPSNGQMGFHEFCLWAKNFHRQDYLGVVTSMSSGIERMPTYDDEDDEEEDIPEDIANLPPDQQARAMLMRSLWNMLGGTVLVLLFSDPAVDVFTEWGVRLGISSFYVSFLLAPFASNASELMVAYGMALKKSSKSVTMSFEALVGAACMNNTLCLGVFFALIYFKKLAWQFKAETLGILVVEWAMAVIIFSSTTQRKYVGLVILALYPLCLAFVYVMENGFGWD